MEKNDYLFIRGLYANLPELSVIGKVGMNIETGERIYLTNYSRSGISEKLENGTLRRFFKDDYSDEIVAKYTAHTYFPERGTEVMSPEVVEAIEKSIDEHMKYNISKGLTTKDLEQNRKRYSACLDLRTHDAIYTAAEIMIGLPFVSLKGLKNIKNQLQMIGHEVGHMKASSINLNSDNDEIIVSTGFDVQRYGIETQPIIDVGNLIIPIDNRSIREEEAGALEEIANELELKEMDPTYTFYYPDFGRRLNEITNGALQLARYSGNLDFFIEELLKIINDEKKAIKLLKKITCSVRYQDSRDIVAVQSLMNSYENAKKIRT